MNESFDHIKENLMEILFLIQQNMNLGQVVGLCQFVTPNATTNLKDPIKFNLSSLTEKQFSEFVRLSQEVPAAIVQLQQQSQHSPQTTQHHHLQAQNHPQSANQSAAQSAQAQHLNSPAAGGMDICSSSHQGQNQAGVNHLGDPILSHGIQQQILSSVGMDNNSCQPLPQQQKLSRPDVVQFSQLYQLFILRTMLQQISIPQLHKFFDISNGRQFHEQLLMFQMLQELFNQTDTETLQNVHVEFNEILKKCQQQQQQVDVMTLPSLLGQVISEHLELPPHLFYLYEPLRVLLQLPLCELENLQTYFPQWDHTRLGLLVRLMELGSVNLCDVQDIISLLVPQKIAQEPPITTTSQPLNSSVGLSPPPPQQPPVYLEISEQPPEKCVYKRNVKPAPSIHLSGDLNISDGYLYIQPVLIRCDTHEEVNHLLDDGGQRVKITSGRTVTFKRLKILSTSHQLNETLFSLKFELRRFSISENQEKYDVLHAVTTVPICVVSHSTQLKSNLKSLPVVNEVIPLSGPPSGATRVAILGSNFIESPTTLVKFDNVEVKPIFHGPKTLICHTPKHPPGTVSVKVCNDLNRWSETEATYTYDGSIKTPEDETVPISQQFNIDNMLPFLQNCDNSSSVVTSMDIFSQINDFGVDIHGFSPLHYTAAFGFLELTLFLLTRGADPLILDKIGNIPLIWAIINGNLNLMCYLLQYGGINLVNSCGDSPLHFAVRYGKMDCVIELVRKGAVLDVQNHDGFTPLHLAILQGSTPMVEYLINCGARPDIVTIDGCTSLHLSSFINQEILRFIAKQSQHFLYSQDECGDTVVHWAVRENDESLLKTLVQLGAPLQTFNFDLESPMGLALELHHYSLVPLLKSANATVSSSQQQKSHARGDSEEELMNFTSPYQSKCPRLENDDDHLITQQGVKKFPSRPSLLDDPFQSSCYLYLNGEDRLSSANWDSLTIG